VVEEKIRKLLEEKLQDEDFLDCFIIDVALKGKKLEIFVDSDSGITFDKCRILSRHLEEHIDAHGWLGEKYTIEVSSPGITRPLKLPRQFKKNIGRTLDVKYGETDRQKGELKEADDEKIVIEYFEITRIKKKKIKEAVLLTIPYENIRRAKVKISFNKK